MLVAHSHKIKTRTGITQSDKTVHPSIKPTMKAEKGMRLLLLLCGHALVGAAELRGTTARMVDPELKNNNPIESHLGGNAVTNTRALQFTNTGRFCKDYKACFFAFGGNVGNTLCCPGVDGTCQGCCGDSCIPNRGDNGTNVPLPFPSPTAPSPTSPAPTASPPTPFEWLEAHNTIRQEYQAIYNAVYVPVVWNDNLAADAQAYANSLKTNYEATAKNDQTCVQTLRPAPIETRFGGENLYVSYGLNRNADIVLQSWKGSATGPAFYQIIWRPSKWIGCGVASSNACFFTVCRYVAPGNCNVDANGTNAIALAMADTSPCEPLVPK